MTSEPREPTQAHPSNIAYEIGYKRPPKHTQFAKGRSGNPKGRPKRRKGFVIRELFDSDQVATNGAKTSTREAYVHQILKGALEGNPKHFRSFLQLMTRSGLFLQEPSTRASVIRFDPGPALSPETYESWKRKKAAEREAQERMNVSSEEEHDANNPRKRRNLRRRKPRAKDNGETTITVFKRLVAKRTNVMQNGKRTTMTLAEAILLKNCNAALRGDPTAMNILWRLAEQGGEFEDRNDPKKVGMPLFMPARCNDIEEFVAFTGVNVIKI